jgi:hypothetical protein
MGTALKKRRGKTTQAVKTAKDWLIDNPLSFPLPPAVSTNMWNMKGSPMGTSSSVAPKRTPQYHEPEPLPAKVTKRSATNTPKRNKKTPHSSTKQPTTHLHTSQLPQPFFSPAGWDFFQLRPPPEPPPRGDVHGHTVHMVMKEKDGTLEL